MDAKIVGDLNCFGFYFLMLAWPSPPAHEITAHLKGHSSFLAWAVKPRAKMSIIAMVLCALTTATPCGDSASTASLLSACTCDAGERTTRVQTQVTHRRRRRRAVPIVYQYHCIAPTPSPTAYPTAFPTPPTPSPTPQLCGTSIATAVAISMCRCEGSNLARKSHFADTRRRAASSSAGCRIFINGRCADDQYGYTVARRRRVLPRTPKYYCGAPAPAPPTPTIFAPTRYPTPGSFRYPTPDLRFPTPRPSGYELGITPSRYTPPTRAPTPPTRAPTPVPHFRRGQPKLVRRTRLRGFTRETFTAGFQVCACTLLLPRGCVFAATANRQLTPSPTHTAATPHARCKVAFRRAIAQRLGRELQDVIITNIRDAAPTTAGVSPPSTEATVPEPPSLRALASAAEGVTFDLQVVAQDTVKAMALQKQVTGANSPIGGADLVAAFEVELSKVVQSGEFEDVSSNLVFDGATLGVTTESTKTAVETSVPTPAPRGGDSSFPLVPTLAGAAALTALVGTVALWRRRASGLSTTGTTVDGAMTAATPGSSDSSREHANPMAKTRVATGAAARQPAVAPSQPQKQVGSLPIGWEACVDKASGHPYYYNGRTGKTTWEMPQ